MKVKTEQIDFTGLDRVLTMLNGLMEAYDEEGTRALLLSSFMDALPHEGLEGGNSASPMERSPGGNT